LRLDELLVGTKLCRIVNRAPVAAAASFCRLFGEQGSYQRLIKNNYRFSISPPGLAGWLLDSSARTDFN